MGTQINKKREVPRRIAGLIFTGFGLIFLVVGGMLTYSTYDFMQNAVTTTGQVVSVDSSYSDGSTTYKPTFSYIGDDGNKHQGTTFLSSSGYDFAVGEKMDILYDTRDYSAVRLTGWFSTWGFGVIFLVSGIVPLLIGRFVRRLAKPAARTEQDDRPEKYVRLDSPESEEDHQRETEYKPTVRRN